LIDDKPRNLAAMIKEEDSDSSFESVKGKLKRKQKKSKSLSKFEIEKI
jgi:hypothetical protein